MMNTSAPIDQDKNKIELQSLTSQTAFDIGGVIVGKIIQDELPVAFEIALLDKVLFFFSAEGVCGDKASWLKRKANTVKRFRMSSLEVEDKDKKSTDDFYRKYGISPRDYAPVGGSLPIFNNLGIFIGTITVSGLKPEEDHDLVLDMVARYKSQYNL